MSMTSFVIATTACPHCGAELDRAAFVYGAASPNEGDLSLCAECGEWAAFGPALTLRVPTDDEFMEIGENAECRRVRAAWLAWQREGRS